MASILGVETLQHTNGTTAVTIDSSGRVLQPAKPAWRGNAGDGVVANYTSLYAFSNYTEDFDIGGNFNNATGIYTIPTTGIYQINGVASGGGSTTSTNTYLYLYVDNSQDTYVREDPQGGGGWHLSYSATRSFTAGQEVEFRFQVSADTGVSVDLFDFSGFLIG